MSATSNANYSGQIITNVRYPQNADDAASKQYVDDAVGGAAALAGTSLTLAQGTLTDPALNISSTVTWNDGADTFTAWKLNVTNTASAAPSLLADLQVGGASRFSVKATGGVGINTGVPAVMLDAYGYNVNAGADSTSITTITRTDATTKQFVLSCPNYTNAEESTPLIAAICDSSQNNIFYGGISANFNGAQGHTFYTTASRITTGGTICLYLSSSGAIVGNHSTPLGRLHITEPAALAGSAYPQIYNNVTWNNGATTHIGWQLNVTDTASAAASLLIDTKIGANSVFQVRKDGSPLILGNTAIPAGGTAGAGLRMSTTSNFGVFFGSGAPSLNAAKGSLYLRSDGSSTTTRAYINTDGAGTWTAISTVA